MLWLFLATMGRNLLLMGFSFLFWNMRGSNTPKKMYTVKRLMKKHKPAFVGLQETKHNNISVTVARYLWGNGAHNFVVIPAVGASGGIVLLSDVDKITVHEIARGTHSVSLLVSLVGSDSKWACITLYGPCDVRKKIPSGRS